MDRDVSGGGAKPSSYSELAASIKQMEKEIPQKEYEDEIDISDLIESEMNEERHTEYKQMLDFLVREGAAHPKQQFKPAAQKQQVEVRDIEELILPKLSFTDQVAELERISEAVAQGVLDQRHMTVVVQEVYGLKSAIALQKNDNEDPALVSFRDSILDDIIKRIGGS